MSKKAFEQIAASPRRISAETIVAAKAMHEQGMSWADISETLGRSRGSGGGLKAACDQEAAERRRQWQRENYPRTIFSHEVIDPVPPPEVLAERRRAFAYERSVFGDPLPGRSALDRRSA